MHHTKIRKPGVLAAWVNHNSDWSGDVYLAWERKGQDVQEVTIPGSVLAGLMTQHVSDEIEEALRSLQKLDKRAKGEE